VITGNTLYGPSAAILLDCISGTVMRDNIVKGNTIISTGAGDASSAIRLGFNAQTCENNSIEGNTISGADFGPFVGAIQLEMAATFTGRGNVVRGNIVKMNCKGYAINVLRQTGAVVTENVLENEHSAAGADTYVMLDVAESHGCQIARNTFVWRNGGTNITARGINVSVGSTNNALTDNRFQMTAAGLTASNEIVNSGTDTYRARNQIDCTVQMQGSFTWTTGTASFVVSNANIEAVSRIVVTPRDADAGVLIQTKGYYLTPAAGQFTIFTGDGTNTAAASDWDYIIE
jgi:hypothetical protein